MYKKKLNRERGAVRKRWKKILGGLDNKKRRAKSMIDKTIHELKLVDLEKKPRNYEELCCSLR
jgi:hypothetical protein